MPVTVLYRRNGGEVVKISPKGQTFSDRNTTYWGVLTDPTFTDGQVCRDADYNLRILSFAKIVEAGTTVRNATQPEIDGFATLEDDDENNQDADAAIDLFESHPRFRKMMIAFASILVDEINILRQQHGLTDRTLAQLKTAIRNRVSKDD